MYVYVSKIIQLVLNNEKSGTQKSQTFIHPASGYRTLDFHSELGKTVTKNNIDTCTHIYLTRVGITRDI